MARVGVKNIVRMELFLWDLEIFLQLQKILGDRLVLIGGAAVQFYLPISDQRTSVDIDMLFRGIIEEIQDALSQVEAKFPHNNETFHFVQHNPKQPKTKLPLYTYYLQVPSVCISKEITYFTCDEEDHMKEIKTRIVNGCIFYNRHGYILYPETSLRRRKGSSPLRLPDDPRLGCCA